MPPRRFFYSPLVSTCALKIEPERLYNQNAYIVATSKENQTEKNTNKKIVTVTISINYCTSHCSQRVTWTSVI